MMKFFRKHNKKLLAVFMVLLMIVFLGGSALDSLLTPDYNQDVATSRYGKITSVDHLEMDRTAQILADFGLDWQRPLGISEPLESTDWILLVREAGKLGLPSDIDRVRSSLADAGLITEIGRRRRINRDTVHESEVDTAMVEKTVKIVDLIDIEAAG